VAPVVLVAEHVGRAGDLDARRVLRHHDHRLLEVAGGGRVGLAHDDEHAAPLEQGVRREPLLPVQDVRVAVALDAQADVGGVEDGDVGSVIENAERTSPSSSGSSHVCLTLLGPVGVEDLHVPGVGRRAVERLGGEADLAELLGDRRVVEVRQLGARVRPVRGGGGRGSRGRAPWPPP
jgi:hypothetical protein